MGVYDEHALFGALCKTQRYSSIHRVDGQGEPSEIALSSVSTSDTEFATMFLRERQLPKNNRKTTDSEADQAYKLRRPAVQLLFSVQLGHRL